MDIRAHNRAAWDRYVAAGNRWTVPADEATIAAAREGRVEIYLTEQKAVPADWFPPLEGLRVLCLASGGGQQGPILAAAGARVTVVDNSPRQLARDQEVAAREGLAIETILGDMRDLSPLPDDHFGLIVHPVSNLFVPEILSLWREAYRVLAPGGLLLAGFDNPVTHLFDQRRIDEEGLFVLRYPMPYSDVTSISEEERAAHFGAESALEFGHSLENQIGGQLAAGFHLTALYESGSDDRPIARFLPPYIATRAVKPAGRGRALLDDGERGGGEEQDEEEQGE